MKSSVILLFLVLGSSVLAAGNSELKFQLITNSGFGNQIQGDPYNLWVASAVDYNGDGAHLPDAVVYDHSGDSAAMWFNVGHGTMAFLGVEKKPYWPTPNREAAMLTLYWDPGQSSFGGLPSMCYTPVGTEGYGLENTLFLNDGAGQFTASKIQVMGLPVDLEGNHRRDYFSKNGLVYEMVPKPRDWGKTPPSSVQNFLRMDASKILGWPAGVGSPNHPLDAKYQNLFSVSLGDPKDLEAPTNLLVYFYGKNPNTGLFVNRCFVLGRIEGNSKLDGWKDVTAELGLPTQGDHHLIPVPINNDDRMDFVDAFTGHSYTNDGTGHFLEMKGAFFQGGGPRGTGDGELHIRDFGNDGHLDIWCATEHSNGFPKEGGLFINNGNGTFSDATGQYIPLSRRDGAVEDLDGDGDADLLLADRTATGTTLKLYRNTATNKAISFRPIPETPTDLLGIRYWVYEPGQLDNAQALIGYGESLLLNGFTRRNVVPQILHVGVGNRETVDLAVMFPSGLLRVKQGVSVQEILAVREGRSSRSR